MAVILSGIQTLLIKQNAEPTAAATEAIEAYEVAFSIQSSLLERAGVAKRSFGNMDHATAVRFGTLSFRTPVRVSGVPSGPTLEKEEALFEAVGMDMATSGSDTAITLLNDPNATANNVHIKFYIDGILHYLEGCRGNLNITAPVGELGWYEWEFTGKLNSSVGAVTGAMPANGEDNFTTNNHQPVHGAEFSIGSFNCAGGNVGRSFSFNLQNEVVVDRDHCDTTHGGYGEVLITNRNPQGQLVVREPELGTHDFYSEVVENNPDFLTTTVYVGSGADLVTQIVCKGQLANLSRVDNQGVADLQMDFMSSESAGNIDDQLVITLT